MSSVAPNVSLQIGINGTDNASVVVAKAQQSVRNFGKEAAAAGAAAEGFSASTDGAAKLVQSTTQRMGGALSAGAAAMGPAAAQLAELGRSATALGSAANVIPGPWGLAAAAIVGAGAAAKLAYDYFDRLAAAKRLLDTPDSRGLQESLKLDADAARQVAGEMSDLAAKGIRPSDEQLARLVKNAKDLGKEPVDAVKAFAAAMKEGPEAVAKFQRENGSIGLNLVSNEQYARVNGLSAKLLGIASAEQTVGQEAAARIQKIQQLEDQAAAARQRQVQELADANERHNGNRKAMLLEQIGGERASFEARIAYQKKALDGLQQQAAIERDGKQAQEQLSELEQLRASRITAAVTKQQAHHLTLIGLQQKRQAIDAAINAAEVFRIGLIDGEVDRQQKLLEVQKNQVSATEKADKAAAKAEAQAAAQKRVAAAKAETDALVGLAAAEDALTQARAAAIPNDNAAAQRALQSAKDLAMLRYDASADDIRNTVKAQKTRTLLLSKAKLEEQATLEDLDRKELARQEAQRKQLADIQAQSAQTVVATEQQRTRSIADALRARGQEEAAVAVELRQAEADRAAALADIDRWLTEQKRQQAGNRIALQELEGQAAQKRLQAEMTLQETQARMDAAADQRQRQAIASAASTVEEAARMAGPAGSAIGMAAQQTAKLAQSWKGIGESAGDAISGIGAIAAATVDGERQKATVLAVTEGAASIAAFAMGNIPGGIGHGIAAAMYGSVAIGAVGTSGSGPVAAAGGANGGPALTGAAGDSAGGTPQTIHVHIDRGVIMGTPHQVAKAITQQMASLKGTGFEAAA